MLILYYNSKLYAMKYNFDLEIDRTVTDCEKYSNNKAIFGTDDIMPLWIADMDFASADFIVDALAKRAEHGVMGYTCRCESFWTAVMEWMENHSGWKIEREWLTFSPGVVAGVVFAMNSSSKEGDGILIQPPVYHPFANVINHNHRKVINNPLVWTENGYRIDFEDFEEKAKQAKVFIMCNPHNPTGRVFTEDELRKMGEICVKHNVVVVCDEIHMDFIYKPFKHTHFASLDKRFADITITLSAPSKSFNIAGLCTAYAVIPNPKLREGYETEMTKIHCDNSNIFGVEALKAAYTKKGEEWLEQMLNYLEANIDFVIDFLHKNIPNVKCLKPEATFLLWFDFREWGISQEQLNDILIKDAKLGLNCGTMYGEQGRGFMRVNIGAPRCTIERAMKQLLHAAKMHGLV